ncbi:unnamed protein product, partial [Staurois parvus]
MVSPPLVIGVWDENGVAGGNPHMYRGNIQDSVQAGIQTQGPIFLCNTHLLPSVV